MPTVEVEVQLRDRGHRVVAGIDEAGRGCWAGPVVAAAVVLRARALDHPAMLEGVDDSKRLSPARRVELLAAIEGAATGIGVGMVPAFLIDCLGIVRATRLAMELAVLQLPALPDALIVDAVRLPTLALHQVPLIGGDRLSFSVAAASIVAKTARDRWMCSLETTPRYGFRLHKGYGTGAHRLALQRWGPSPQHRLSFRPLWSEEYLYDRGC